MTQMYHYATVSKALDELNENGFSYDFNLHEEDIAKNPQKYEIKHIYRYEGNTDPGDEAVVYGIQSNSGKKGVFVTGFAANSISDAAQALINIGIKNRTK
ncbi:hypothetical protein CXF59_02460 [Flavobacterium sp. ALD4]|uniref:hypothetical protein n=1 Tax=Flavobacterium sp. ALD4 TaxID=2058314 RepID=UPI000C341532|nr:hypothetical protein [Flavobacterium sp. ALD4]PKH68222.1 hypothetical protein CXF59_02460 [Flavobacterium sp. ALD4]